MAINKTSIVIRAAFASGDIATAMSFHHPDIIKALSYNKHFPGCKAVEEDLTGTFKVYNITFEKNIVETFLSGIKQLFN